MSRWLVSVWTEQYPNADDGDLPVMEFYLDAENEYQADRKGWDAAADVIERPFYVVAHEVDGCPDGEDGDDE